jgi:hypothetical protein
MWLWALLIPKQFPRGKSTYHLQYPEARQTGVLQAKFGSFRGWGCSMSPAQALLSDLTFKEVPPVCSYPGSPLTLTSISRYCPACRIRNQGQEAQRTLDVLFLAIGTNNLPATWGSGSENVLVQCPLPPRLSHLGKSFLAINPTVIELSRTPRWLYSAHL